MKKIIIKILKRFLTYYRLYVLVGRGKKIYLKIDDMPILADKDLEKYHNISVTYWIKSKKKVISIDGISVYVNTESVVDYKFS